MNKDVRSIPRWKKGLYAVITVTFFFLLTETLLFLFDLGTPFQRKPHFWSGEMGFMQFDPHTGLKMRPNLDFWNDNERLNSLGLRDDELNPNAAVHILSLGDSCAFGWPIETPRMSYSDRLEEFYNARHGKDNLEVFNAGVPSYTVYQGYRLYQNYLMDLVDWDFLIVSFGLNEVPGQALDLEYVLYHPPIQPLFKKTVLAARNLRTYNVMERLFWQIDYHFEDDPNLLANKQYKIYYRKLIDLARSRGTQVVILPVLIQPKYHHTAQAKRMRYFNEFMRAVAVKEGLIFVELEDVFLAKRSDISWFDNIHYDRNGHEIIAQELLKVLNAEIYSAAQPKHGH